tara:strand:- start:767 stop:970 length:204 start_codon:yes stop_codon:yes gene_type:complete
MSNLTGTKRFHQTNNIGRAKYTVSFHDGQKTHSDGSLFFDIGIFRNLKELGKFRQSLIEQGFKEVTQ